MTKFLNKIMIASALIAALLFSVISFSHSVSADAQTQSTGTASATGITAPPGTASQAGTVAPVSPDSLESFIVDNGKCYYSIIENGKVKYIKADYKDKVITGLQEMNEPLEEKTLPGSKATIGRPLTANGYLKGYIALKKETGRMESAAYFKKDFSQHMDLFELNVPESEAIDLIFVSKDLRYFFYTQRDQNVVRLMAYDLAQNQTMQINDTGRNYIVEQNGESFSFYQAVLQKGSSLPVFVKLNGDNEFYSDEAQSVKTNMYDTVIQNGIVVDPETETIKFGYNVGIDKDKIEIITKQPINGRKKIDATGLVVSPGFIDMLSFNMTSTAAKYKVTDGVTTCLSMHGCTEDFKSFFSGGAKNPPLVNYGGALFEVKLRREVGVGDYSKPTKSQIDYIVKRTREEILNGAVAVAFSPEYYPGTSPEEIKAVMKVAKEYNVPTHFHGRYSNLTGEHTSIDTVKEILGYAKELKAPVHFMHLHSTGGTGCMDEALKMIDDARAQGYQVSYDIYPYDSWASRLNMARFSGDWQKRFNITFSDLQIPTKAKGLDKNSFAKYRASGALCIAYAMEENEVIAALKEDYCMIGSDDAVYTPGGANSHPRASGTFARVIGRYSRDLDEFSMMDALQKMTSNSAKHLEDIAPAMKIRGRLREGFVADITIFDYFTINDRATALDPAVTSTGIPYVIVSGQTVLDNGLLHTSARSGKPIKGVFSR